MKKIILTLFLVSSLIFAGGEISFKKQKEKLQRLEEAKLEAIKNTPIMQKNSETEKDIEEDTENDEEELNLEEEIKKKQKKQS